MVVTAPIEAKEGPARSKGSHSVLPKEQLACLIAAFLIGVIVTLAPALAQGGKGLTRWSRAPPCPAPLLASGQRQQQRTQSDARRLVPPWEPLLTREELRRGLTYYGSGQRMERLAAKLLAGEPIKVYLLGASVTKGGGSTDPSRSYARRFFSYINATFPHRDHVFANKAISASTAFLFSMCLNHHVPQDADLVVLEFTVNESKEANYTSIERRSFEQLLRRLLTHPNRPAVVMLHHYAYLRSIVEGTRRPGLFYVQPEEQLTAFSHYYDIPAVSLRAAAWRLMNADVERFKISKVLAPEATLKFTSPEGQVTWQPYPAAAEDEASDYFYFDPTHPTDIGHQALAELLAQPLMHAAKLVQSGQALGTADSDRRRDPRLPPVPPPMIPESVDEKPGLCAMLEDFKPLVVAAEGFEYLPERPNASDFIQQKWGWRGSKPGDWAELEIDTRSDSGSPQVWLAHLKSYEHMGTADIACVSGCRCARSRLDGTWRSITSVMWVARFSATQSANCRIRVTVSDKPGQVPQEGHKVTLMAVMTTNIPLEASGSLKNVKAFDMRD